MNTNPYEASVREPTCDISGATDKRRPLMIWTYSIIQCAVASLVAAGAVYRGNITPQWMSATLFTGSAIALIASVGLWKGKWWGWWLSMLLPVFVIYSFSYALLEKCALDDLGTALSSTTARQWIRLAVAIVIVCTLLTARIQAFLSVKHFAATFKFSALVFPSVSIHGTICWLAGISPPPAIYAAAILSMIPMGIGILRSRWKQLK